MIQKYNRISLAVGIPGFLVQLAGFMYDQSVLYLLGTVLLFAGFVYYLKGKGRHPAWALMAVFGLLGIIFMGLMKDLSREQPVSAPPPPPFPPAPEA